MTSTLEHLSAVSLTGGDELAQGYEQAAWMVRDETDAAWVAAHRAAFIAETIGAPLAVAESLFRMAHNFLTVLP